MATRFHARGRVQTPSISITAARRNQIFEEDQKVEHLILENLLPSRFVAPFGEPTTRQTSVVMVTRSLKQSSDSTWQAVFRALPSRTYRVLPQYNLGMPYPVSFERVHGPR
ncbi:hypothetical protein OIU85_005571 [Salix viminalis]|uniref:Uncharacterized protein n=1 Tax=Salix viminalis TaxID=40686 RepID=A0A9Q0SU58_SALVM|nr:hypothetical protein OIU85_005571 [Salix viminalis]